MSETQNKPAAFKGQKDQIWVKCTARCLGDNGVITEVPFKLRVRRYTISQIKDLAERFNTKLAATDFESELNVEFVTEVCTEWDIRDTSNEPIPFDDENINAALDIPEYHAAIVRGVMASILGRKELRQGN